jgi:hypothetical protein
MCHVLYGICFLLWFMVYSFGFLFSLLSLRFNLCFLAYSFYFIVISLFVLSSFNFVTLVLIFLFPFISHVKFNFPVYSLFQSLLFYPCFPKFLLLISLFTFTFISKYGIIRQ